MHRIIYLKVQITQKRHLCAFFHMINVAYLHRLRKSTIKYILVTGAIFCICFLHTNISYDFRILEIKLFELSFILFEWCFCHYWSFTDPGYWLFSLHRNKHANSAKHCFLCLMKKVWMIWWLCITYFIMPGRDKSDYRTSAEVSDRKSCVKGEKI